MFLKKMMKSIRTKLVINSTIIIMSAFIVTLLVNIFIVNEMSTQFRSISEKNGSNVAGEIDTIFKNNKEKIRKLIEDQVNLKSKSLLNEAELVFSPALSDGSFSFISQLLHDRVDLDEDIVYASFFTKDQDKVVLWTMSNRFQEIGMVFGARYNQKTKSWEANTKLAKAKSIYDEKIASILAKSEPTIEKYTYKYKDDSGKEKEIESYDVFTPVYASGAEDSSQIGYLRYILSLDRMRALLAQEDEKMALSHQANQSKLHKLLEVVTILTKSSFQNSIKYVSIAATIMVFLSIILFYFMAKKITVPILELKNAAVTISSGNYSQAVAVKSSDEVGVLATTFDQMRLQVKMFTEHLQRLVDQRTAELRDALAQVTEEKQKIQEILTHIDQGILMFDESLQILDQYSENIKKIYECEVSDFVGADIFKFMFNKAECDQEALIRNIEALKMSISDDYLAWLGNKSHLLEEISLNVGQEKKILTLSWHPIVNEDNVIKKIIVSLFDVTQKRALEAEVALEKQRNRQLISAITNILPHDPAVISQFLQQTKEKLNEILQTSLSQSSEEFSDVCVQLHTIKGNSRMFELSEFTGLIHDTETLLKSNGDIQQITSKLNLCMNILDLHIDVFENVLKLGKNSAQTQSLFSIINMRISEIVKKVEGEKIGIDALVCEDGVINWNPSLLGKISDILTHAIANAIDHGYIIPKRNGVKSKPIRIQVSARPEANHLSLSITDWGAGINFAKIKEIAKDRNLPHDTEEQLSDVLFRPSVSTADKVTLTSGRGDGMAAIKNIAESLNATIVMKNVENAGAQMRIEIPREKDELSKAS